MSDEAGADAASAVRAFFETALAGSADPGRVLAALAPDFVDHNAAGSDAGTSGVVEKLTTLWSAVPDGRFRILQLVASEDVVAVRSVLEARDVSVPFADFYRVRGGLLTEHWHVVDNAELGRQLAARG